MSTPYQNAKAVVEGVPCTTLAQQQEIAVALLKAQADIEGIADLVEAARHVAWEAETGEVTDSSLALLLEMLALYPA